MVSTLGGLEQMTRDSWALEVAVVLEIRGTTFVFAWAMRGLGRLFATVGL